jgi:hypothetical protein
VFQVINICLGQLKKIGSGTCTMAPLMAPNSLVTRVISYSGMPHCLRAAKAISRLGNSLELGRLLSSWVEMYVVSTAELR